MGLFKQGKGKSHGYPQHLRRSRSRKSQSERRVKQIENDLKSNLEKLENRIYENYKQRHASDSDSDSASHSGSDDERTFLPAAQAYARANRPLPEAADGHIMKAGGPATTAASKKQAAAAAADKIIKEAADAAAKKVNTPPTAPRVAPLAPVVSTTTAAVLIAARSVMDDGSSPIPAAVARVLLGPVHAQRAKKADFVSAAVRQRVVASIAGKGK